MAQPPAARRRVVLDNDAGIDDLVALAILVAHPELIDLVGVVVVDADCFIDPAFEVTGKLLSGVGMPHVPVGKSTLLGLHKFPNDWRKDAINMNDLPCVNTAPILATWEGAKRHAVDIPGEQLLADLVMKAPGDQKTTIVATGPLSNVAWALERYGDAFASRIDEIVIMGGAVDVAGNVFHDIEPTVDQSQEWNIFWDAPAAKIVLAWPGLRCVLFSLDSTNSVPVTSSFVQQFGAQNEFLLSQFVGASWAMCTHLPFTRGASATYFAWDALTAAYLIDPGLVRLDPVAIEVVTGAVPGEGRTPRSATGRVSFIARDTNPAKFYACVLECCRCGPSSKPGF